MRIKPSIKPIYLNNIVHNIIKCRLNYRDIVKISLYLAQDCLDLIYSSQADYCIHLVESWLKNESISNKTFSDAYFDNVNKCSRDVAANAVWAAWHSGISIRIIESSLYKAVNKFPQSERADKEQEYFDYVKIFAYEDELWNHNFQFIPFQFNQPSASAEVAMFLDQLEENYQDRKVFTFDNFIYNSDFELIAPIKLKGENKLDLIRKIYKSRFAIDYLNHLYSK